MESSKHLNISTKASQNNGVNEDFDTSLLKSGITNGHADLEGTTQNGVDISDGHFKHRRRKEHCKMTTMERDIISLIGQHLRENGYSKTLDTLVEEAGCTMEHPLASGFRVHILRGEWNEALLDLELLSPFLGDHYCGEKMRLLLLEEKFLEHIENGEKLLALQCLREDLVSLPVHHPGKRIQDLSQYLMCQTKEELYQLSHWPGVENGARQTLLDQMQAFLPPSIMLPPKRLELLLRQSIQLQVDKCPFHYTEKDVSSYSLLTDHICQRSQFPSEIVHTLKAHNDEVWFVEFSHDGNMLASSGKDGTIIIWKVALGKTPTQHLCLKGQSSGVTSLLWSPDDSLLLSCGTEDCPEVIVFDSKTGDERCRVNNSPDDSLTCGCWCRNSTKFYVGGLRGNFYECSAIDGSVTNSWEGIRVHGIAAHPCNNNTVYAADSHLRIRQYNFEEKTSSTIVKEDHPIMTFRLSMDARYALLNVASQGVHVWDLVDRCMIKRYQGVTQGHFTIHSCFGIDDTFIASGSEDNNVYVWNRKRETPVIVLQGHTRTVNCVCWNPVHHSMIVSASDDCTVRVWGTEDEMKHQRELERLKLEQRKLKKSPSKTNNTSITTSSAHIDTNEEDDLSNDGDGCYDNDEIDSNMYGRISSSRPLSEIDLHSLEILDPDSSSQEGSHIDAAVSLSTLSASNLHTDITLNTQNTTRALPITPATGPGSGMLVIMSGQGFRGQEEGGDIGGYRVIPSQPQSIMPRPLLEHEPQSLDLDSSIDSDASGERQLHLLHAALSELDHPTPSEPLITPLPPPDDRGHQRQGDVPPSQPSANTDTPTSDSESNGTSRTRNSSRARDRDERSIATESSVSTVV